MGGRDKRREGKKERLGVERAEEEAAEFTFSADLSILLLKISGEGNSAHSLGNMSQLSLPLTVRKFFCILN